jgi:hypothetical protein
MRFGTAASAVATVRPAAAVVVTDARRAPSVDDQLHSQFSPQVTGSALLEQVVDFAQTDGRGRCSLSVAKQMLSLTFDLKRLAACTCGSTISCWITKGPDRRNFRSLSRSVLFGSGPQVAPRPPAIRDLGSFPSSDAVRGRQAGSQLVHRKIVQRLTL